jgi:hypothetical protein
MMWIHKPAVPQVDCPVVRGGWEPKRDGGGERSIECRGVVEKKKRKKEVRDGPIYEGPIFWTICSITLRSV